jgi:hypothetical protein
MQRQKVIGVSFRIVGLTLNTVLSTMVYDEADPLRFPVTGSRQQNHGRASFRAIITALPVRVLSFRIGFAVIALAYMPDLTFSEPTGYLCRR